MSIYLIFFYIRKPVGSPPHPAACLPAVGMSPKNEFAIAPLSITELACSILNLK